MVVTSAQSSRCAALGLGKAALRAASVIAVATRSTPRGLGLASLTGSARFARGPFRHRCAVLPKGLWHSGAIALPPRLSGAGPGAFGTWLRQALLPASRSYAALRALSALRAERRQTSDLTSFDPSGQKTTLLRSVRLMLRTSLRQAYFMLRRTFGANFALLALRVKRRLTSDVF